MMVMAQHPQQQLHHGRQKQPQQPAHVLANTIQAPTKSNAKTTSGGSNLSQGQQHHNHNHQKQPQQEQDGKRTLIKNQLYLIEQLQLENANLRNERDQLQLENEELKFQLQMISSSNILIQPGEAFKNQQLERLVEGNEKLDANNIQQQQQASSRLTSTTSPTAATLTTTHSNQIKILATPLRQPQRHNSENQQVLTGSINQTLQSLAKQIPPLIDVSSRLASTTDTSGGSLTSTVNKLIRGKSTSLTAFNVKSTNVIAPQSRTLPHDDEEHRVKLVEQLYGDSEKVQAAAIIIQRAFRKYQICKRFRTITEQLRHTYQTVNQTDKRRESPRPSSQNNNNNNNQKTAINDLPYASGATRAAAWESLSYAASRLAASAGAVTSSAKQSLSSGIIRPLSSQNAFNGSAAHSQQQHRSVVQQLDAKQSTRQDPVVAAAINFQQLESIRKRQYRVGLNVFNKNPEKGVSFLVAHSFIDSSSPYTKTSTSYYHSNQLHFMDKHYLVQQQQASTNQVQSCQLCCEEDNLKRNVAHFLLHRKGLAKEKIGQYLGNLQAQFNQDVLRYYLQELDFNGLQIDVALRKFLSTFRLPGEAQKIEKIVDCFAQRYVKCQQQQQQPAGNMVGNANIVAQIQLHQNQSQQQHTLQQQAQSQQSSNYKNNLMLLTKDEIFILTFAIIMLNTDLHSPSLKPTSRMSASQFVNNLRGVFKSQTINESDLTEIYDRVKANQISTTPDHVSHVMKVQQGLTVTNFQRKELPNLCVPHRRLVCFCRLFEVYDVNKKERVGQHQREIFLFNDLLLVTKLARRVRANAMQMYTYRQSISLQGLYVRLFESPHYNFGIKLCQRSNDETIIMFNARNELDQSRFVEDLGESIAEMDEMETIKSHNIIESIHLKYLDRLRRHAAIHSINDQVQMANVVSEDNLQFSKAIIANSCDNRILEAKRMSVNIEKQQQAGTSVQAGSNRSSSEGRGLKSKFSSMLNLSSAAGSSGDSSPSTKDESQADKPKGLRQNQSFVLQQQQNSNSSRQDQVHPNAAQRRCSTSSVHSLDSGLFLSRDVSPNQSS